MGKREVPVPGLGRTTNGKKLHHLFDSKRGSHTASQHRNKKAKGRGTKGAFGKS